MSKTTASSQSVENKNAKWDNANEEIQDSAHGTTCKRAVIGLAREMIR
jgi:hypothetical protein